MKTSAFPAPNGIPAAIGTAQCTFGVHVQANQISPTGIRIAARQTGATIASGGGLPVSGSGLCELIHFRISGSRKIAIIDPIPMPTNERPVIPADQPRKSVKTIGYATKQRYRIP